MNRLSCVETKKINNPQVLSNVIYNNFYYLKDFPELMHHKEGIVNTINSNGNLSYLVYDGNKLISYLIGDFRILSDSRYVYYISYIFVSEQYRNKKIGSNLMNIIIRKCNNNGIKFITLTCDMNDKKIIDFYQKYGFVKDPIFGTTNRHNIFSLFL